LFARRVPFRNSPRCMRSRIQNSPFAIVTIATLFSIAAKFAQKPARHHFLACAELFARVHACRVCPDPISRRERGRYAGLRHGLLVNDQAAPPEVPRVCDLVAHVAAWCRLSR
jgi:hypothetical protein